MLLIAPTGLDNFGKPILKERVFLPALTLPQMAAIIPDSVDVTICTETCENIPYDEHWDLVGITGMGGSGVVRAWQLADFFRKKGAKVIMGGIAMTLCPDEWTLEHADVLVCGEAEDLLPEVVNDFVNGRLKNIYRMTKTPDVTKFPVPAYHKLDRRKYGFWRPVQATRGCPFPCTFCSISEFFQRSYRKRPVDQVVRDIKATGSRFITFIDDNIGVDFKYCKELFEALIPLNIRWASQCSIQISENEDMLALAAKSGCRILSFGIETVNEKSLAQVDKEWNRPDRYAKALATVRKHGIEVSTEMIIGLDGDDVSVFDKTFDFIMENRIALPRMYIITPVPGTPFYDEMESEGRIFDRDLSKYTGGWAVLKPKLMSAETLQTNYWKLYQKLYSVDNIYKRIGSNVAHLSPRMRAFVAATNLHYRSHIGRNITPGII